MKNGIIDKYFVVVLKNGEDILNRLLVRIKSVDVIYKIRNDQRQYKIKAKIIFSSNEKNIENKDVIFTAFTSDFDLIVNEVNVDISHATWMYNE